MLNLNGGVVYKNGQEETLILNKTPEKVVDHKNGIELTKEEARTILLLIKESQFKGEFVEKIYKMTCKIQDYYLSLP